MGSAGVDSRLHEYVANSRLAGVVTGFYHLFRSDSDGVPQAQHYLATTAPYLADALWLAVDVESVVNPQRVLSKAQYAEQLAAFVQHIEAETGDKPVIYTSAGEWNKLVGTQHDALFAQCLLWVASWIDAPKPILPRCWYTWDLWQFTSSGSVPGIVGRVDLNRWHEAQTALYIAPADFPYVISSRFNDPRNYWFAPNRKQLHEGTDFAPTSAAIAPFRVVAPRAGEVVKVGFDARGYGNYLVIDHGDSMYSWLAHLKDPPLVQSGRVEQGQLVGYAGSTGSTSTATHLHWTLQDVPEGLDNYVVRDVVDPELYLK